MRIFGARIFSKFFGGKIKIGACVFQARVFFLSFLAGKLKILTWVTLEVNLGSQDNFYKTFNKQEKQILYKTNSTKTQLVSRKLFKLAFGWEMLDK